jgi:hypothetical protein
VVKKPPQRRAQAGRIAPMVAMALKALAAIPQRTAQAKLQHRQIRR